MLTEGKREKIKEWKRIKKMSPIYHTYTYTRYHNVP